MLKLTHPDDNADTSTVKPQSTQTLHVHHTIDQYDLYLNPYMYIFRFQELDKGACLQVLFYHLRGDIYLLLVTENAARTNTLDSRKLT